MRIRHRIIKAIRDFFDERDFVLMDPPILTPNAVEGTSTLFETPYFDLGNAYLTQSGQLYAEAGAMAHGKVYTFGPTFRAEKSKTRRHLTEFWMCEPEVAFADLNDDMDLAESMLEYIVQTVLKERAEELKILERDTSKLEKVVRPFPRRRAAGGRSTSRPRPVRQKSRRCAASRRVRLRQAVLDAIEWGVVHGRLTSARSVRATLRRMLITTSEYRAEFAIRRKLQNVLDALQRT